MTEKTQKNWIANFWKRIGAIFIDTLILGLTGFLLGQTFESTFVQIGGWGRLIGFIIGLIYFGSMNSKLFNGQTVGKRIFNIRVADSNNQSIPLIKSVFRYIILTAPFSLNGAPFSNETLLSYWIYPLSMIVFGGGFSIIYLYIFNRVTRQSLHDLALHTFVVNANIEKQAVGKIWKPHLAIVIVFFSIAVLVPSFSGKLAQNQPFKQMRAVQSALLNEKGVNHAMITSNKTIFSSSNQGTKTTTDVTTHVFLSSNNINDVELARKLATIVVQNYPETVDKDALRVKLTYGYDIGIWSQWSSRIHDFNPDEFAGMKQP